MKLGIRLKLVLVSLVLVAISVAAAEVYLTGRLEAQLTERIRADLLVRARLVAQRAMLAETTSAVVSVDAMADALGRSAEARVTLIRPDGTVAGDSDVEAAQLAVVENHSERPEVIAAIAAGEGTSVRYSTTTRQRMMYVAVPVGGSGGGVATARVAMPLTAVDTAMGELRRTLRIAGVVALGVVVIVSIFAAELMSRKLRELTRTARKMAEGNLAIRSRVAGDDEIVALGTALDQLAQNLSRSLDELRDERDLLTGVLSSMQEGVLVVSRGRVVLTNPALRSMLLIGEDAIGKSPLQVIRNADLNALLERAGASGSSTTELELGGLRPARVLVHAVTLQAAGGGILAVFVDVTELRRLESVRRDFVANASHELRSPLTTVRAAAETLRSVKDDPAAAQKFIELIERNAERLAALIDDLLTLSQVESRELRLDMERIELAGAVARIVAQHAHRAEVKGISIAQALDVPPVLADRRALEHVLGNLVDNALKYCPEGATVRISAEADNGIARVAVADSGPGIPAQHLPRIFERFYRVDAGRSRELGGTGLGLSIVKHLVEAMGGSVSVDSRPGAGSTFSFTLRQA